MESPARLWAHHRFVKTTPKPRATKNSNGELVVLFPPLDGVELPLPCAAVFESSVVLVSVVVGVPVMAAEGSTVVEAGDVTAMDAWRASFIAALATTWVTSRIWWMTAIFVDGVFLSIKFPSIWRIRLSSFKAGLTGKSYRERFQRRGRKRLRLDRWRLSRGVHGPRTTWNSTTREIASCNGDKSPFLTPGIQ